MGRKITHGMTNTRLYRIWWAMRERCKNKKRPNYKYYGEKGIMVCPEWDGDFRAFYDWSMANGYKDNLTIDRVNGNGNYEPSNCRWVTPTEQVNNRPTYNHILTLNGEAHTIAEWARLLNINRTTINARLKLGWSVEKALTTTVLGVRK